jgi:hypothetical protein
MEPLNKKGQKRNGLTARRALVKIVENKSAIIKIKVPSVKDLIEVDTLSIPKVGDTMLLSKQDAIFLKRLEKSNSCYFFRCLINKKREKVYFQDDGIKILGVVRNNMVDRIKI